MNAQLLTAATVVVAGISLLIAGFIAPPLGRIDPTVLTAFGEALTFGGALLGIDYRYRQPPHNTNPT